MGLDMFLFMRKPIFEFMIGEDKFGKLRTAIRELFPEIPASMVVNELRYEAMYWRKANHIHNWFVQNVQNGEDDCGEYRVTRDNLEDLIDVCKRVLANPALGKELLPTTEGFFFGSTEYDDGYIDDIHYTIRGLKSLLNEELKDCDFYYHSSW